MTGMTYTATDQRTCTLDELFNPTYSLPNTQESTLKFRTVEFKNKYGQVELRVPKMQKNILENVVENLDVARSHLIQKPVYEIRNAISENTKLWLKNDFQYRRLAEEVLPIVTGFSPQMVHTFLDQMMSKMSKELHQMPLSEKKNNIERIFCVLEETPGPEILGITKALCNKSTIFCKSPSNEPLFAALYAQSFTDVDRELADCIAVAPWKGGDPESQDLENFIYGKRTAKDLIVVFGNNDTVDSIKQKINPEVKFVQFTRGISFGIIGKEMLKRERIDSVVRDAAYAACVYDQRACFSPQMIYVEKGGETTPEQFSEQLAKKMQELEVILPRGDIPFDASAVLTGLIRTYDFLSLMDKENFKIHKIESEGRVTGAVIYQNNQKLETSCLNRVVRVKPVDDISEIPGLVRSFPSLAYLHTIGVALSGKKKEKLEDLKKLGLRITPFDGIYPSLLEYELFDN